MKKKFLTTPRRKWLATFFQNATVVLLAGAVGSEVFLKISWPWRAVLMVGMLGGFGLGVFFATDKTEEN